MNTVFTKIQKAPMLTLVMIGTFLGLVLAVILAAVEMRVETVLNPVCRISIVIEWGIILLTQTSHINFS